MNIVTSLILRQMRTPIIIVILGYSIAILGMTLTPGVDDQGKPWHMSIFDAIYFVSFTATTIGFGEIPYELSSAQRMWALVTIYITVVSWFYALGKIISLIQDPTFKEAVRKNTFRREINNIHGQFILICGFGETGSALALTLSEHNLQTVIIEQNQDIINTIPLRNFTASIPSTQGDASDPEQLILAGLKHPRCKAVIAVTASDEINLKISITSKLLNPDICVISRSEIQNFEENMYSFGTNYVINPFQTFSNIFAMAMHSPSLFLLYDWLTGVPQTDLSNPIYIKKGHWIICGFGRFGKALYERINKANQAITIIDPSEDEREKFIAKAENRHNDFILGTGFDAHTLQLARIEEAVGIISGTNNDSNNLSIIMTARDLNPDIFVVSRQNHKTNEPLFDATAAEIVMKPSDIIARKIRTLITSPLMISFLNEASKQPAEWANVAISRLSGALGERRPNVWTVVVSETNACSLHQVLKYGRVVRIGNLLSDPRSRDRKLKCVPLLLKRGNKVLLMPTDDIAIKPNDHILFCGTPDTERSMKWMLNNIHSLNYIMTYEDTPDAHIWRKLHSYIKQQERRSRSRKHLN